MAELMQSRVEKELVISVAGVGPVLLPGPQGFALKSGGWKLNPSYLPLQVLRGLASEVPAGPWSSLAESTVVMIESVTPRLLVPDWIVVRPERGFSLDAEAGFGGGYEAIRTYLWAAMMSKRDPYRARLLARMGGMAALVDQLQAPPERIDAFSGRPEGSGPVGFSVALLPYLEAVGTKASVERQKTRIIAMGGIPSVYYEQALGLFARGWIDRRFRFASDGRLDWGVPATCDK
jgi:endoglucanase